MEEDYNSDEFNFDRAEVVLAGNTVKTEEKGKSIRTIVDSELAKLFGAKAPLVHNLWVGVNNEYLTLSKIEKILSDNLIPYRADDFVKSKLKCGNGHYFFHPIYDEFGGNGTYWLLYSRNGVN